MGQKEDCESKGGRVVILAGAGASRDLGYSLSGESLWENKYDQEFRDLMSQVNGKCRGKSPAFELLISTLQKYEDIAELVHSNWILQQHFFGPNYATETRPLLEKSLDEFDDALKKCYQIMAESYGPATLDRESTEYMALPIMLKTLARLNRDRLNIYTTNYDCSYQVLGSHADDLAICSRISNVEADHGQFKEDRWYSIKEELQGRLPEVRVHRLHGCVAWFNDKDINDRPTGITREVHGAGGGGPEEDSLIIKESKLRDMCIKLTAARLLGTNRVFTSAFEEFDDQLKTIKALIVWGYSFSDLEVTRHINEALRIRGDDPFKIYFIDPPKHECAVSEAIFETLKGAPVRMSEHFKPIRIEWTPAQNWRSADADDTKSLTSQLTKIFEEANQ